jgi:site-specific DNA-methyltransferase (adenine-specific)
VIVTSPVYNIGKSYSGDETKDSKDDYLGWMHTVLAACYRPLSAHGHLFLQMGGTPTRPLIPHEVLSRALAAGFKLQNDIIWVKSISIGEGAEDSHGHFTPMNSHLYLNNTHEHIFHLTKTGKEKINRLAIGVQFKDKSNIRRFNHGADVRCRGNSWFIPFKVTSKADRNYHPAPFPVDLPAMCIKLAGVPQGSLVVDPFLGTGTTLVACKQLGMRGIGFDTSAEYCAMARQRLSAEPEAKASTHIA